MAKQLVNEGYGRDYLCLDSQILRSIPIRPADATVTILGRTGPTYLHIAVVSFARRFYRRQSLETLRSSIINLIKAGTDTHARVNVYGFFGTPLLLLMIQQADFSVERLEKLAEDNDYARCSHCALQQRLEDSPLTEWLQILFDAGINLAQYGQVEESFLKERGGRIYPLSNVWYLICRTLTFSYGSGVIGLEIKYEDHWIEDVPGGKCFCFDDTGNRLTPEEINETAKVFDAERRRKKLAAELKRVKVPGSWE